MRTFVAFIFLLMSVNGYGQKDKNLWSHWRDNGSTNLNVADNDYGYFMKGGFYYYISNDDKYVYLDIKIKDSGIENTILRQGLTIWINANDKRTKKTGVKYPLGARGTGGYRGRNNENQGVNSNTDNKAAVSNSIELIGFQQSGPIIIPAMEENDFNGTINYDKMGNLLYTVRMPISRFDFIKGKKASGYKPFSMGVEYRDMPAQGNSRGQTPRSNSGRMSSYGGGYGGGFGGGFGGRSGGGMRMGGGYHGGGMQGRSMNSQQTENTRLLWVKKIRFAVNH